MRCILDVWAVVTVLHVEPVVLLPLVLRLLYAYPQQMSVSTVARYCPSNSTDR